MNQKEFIAEVANKFDDVPKTAIKEILNAMKEVIVDAIKDEDSVQFFPGFDIYGARTKSYETTKAIDGTRFILPSRVEPRVKFGRRFREKVRKGYRDYDSDQ